MSGGGGIIIIGGKNAAGQQGGGGTVTQSQVSATLDVLTGNGVVSAPVQQVINALQSALEFSET
jgi:hypothetical protein